MGALKAQLLVSLLVAVTGESLLNDDSNQLLSSNCPCENADWCKPFTREVKNEVFIFILSEVNWPLYDWSRVTTVVQFSKVNDSLTCFAHSRGARSVFSANFPAENLTNKADRTRWVTEKVKFAQQHFLDGINIDFEYEIDKDDTAKKNGLTLLMEELASAFRASFSNPQVTYDVAWSPDGIDKRFYDYKAIASIVDFIFVMSYDERSQIYGDCIAYANAAVNTTIYGVERYLSLGVSPRKIVLGIPWYGYIYPCLSLNKNICSIKKVPFRGVECSDAAGREINYSDIMENYLPKSTTGLMWNTDAQSPFFNWKDSKTGQMHQIWFDNPKSLTYKYKYAVTKGLLGVGMWHADAVDYSNTHEGKKQRWEMWQAIPFTKKI